MIVVDTHCHAGRNWFEPIELLLHQMNANDVDHAVLIQHGGNFEATYLLECVNRYPGRFAAVAIVDTAQPDAVSELEKWADAGVIGIRFGPADRSPGQDPLAIWRKASELDLVVSCQGTVEEFAAPDFHDLVSQLPDLTVVIEHLAGAVEETRAPFTEFNKALTLANFPNTYIKVPGLGEFCHRPPVMNHHFSFDEVPPLIEMTYDSFGPCRMMWGSDYPPVSSREGYRNALRGVFEHPVWKSQSDKEWVMGKTALNVFSFDKR